VSVLRGARGAWALVVAPAPGRSDGAVRVRAVRVPDTGVAETVWTGEAPGDGAVSKLARTRDGAAFAVARGRAITVYELTASGPPRERPLPRGESPPGRDAVTPSLALAAESEGDGHLTLLARWPPPWGTRHLSTRDVREGGPMTPRRRDAFVHPDLALVGDVVLLAQERRKGTFLEAPVRDRGVEFVVMDASPAHPDLLATLAPPHDAGPSSMPRVSLVDPAVPPRGALAAWRDDHGLVAAHVRRDDHGHWTLGAPLRVSDDRRDGAPFDVGSLPGPCNGLLAWRDGDAVVARAFEATGSTRVGPPTQVSLPAGVAVAGVDPRVRLERGGNRTVLAVDTAQGVRAFDVTVTDACALSLTPIGLPSGFAGARLAGTASSGDRVALVATPDPPDAVETRAHFVTLPAAGGVRVHPAAETLPQGVSAMGLFEGGIAVVAGRAHGSVMLRRVGDAHDDEPGEDLLLRAMRGEDLAVEASAAHHRVWVADVTGDEESPFGPPRSVVVHSAIDTLEDGPRTEVRTATVPEADFAVMTLGVREGDGLRGATWSGSTGEGCIPGAWASRHDRDDRGVTGTWQWMVPLVPEALRRCGDRVHTALWRGDTLHAAVSGERFGTRLVIVETGRGEARWLAFDERPGARVRQASIDRWGEGVFAVWLDGDPRAPAVRCRLFSREGSPRTGVIHLGEVLEAPVDASEDGAVPVSVGPGGIAVLLRTSHGPRLARVACGAIDR